MSTLQKAYDHAPIAVQNVMLSLYGVVLRYRRYGPMQRAKTVQLARSERLTSPELAQLQLNALKHLTAAASRDVPFYHGRLPTGGVSSFAELRDLPILSKSEVQAAGKAMVSTRYRGSRLQKIYTGGTTGTPLTIYCDRKALQHNYAFFSRFRTWAGFTTADRTATFAGRNIVPAGSGAPFWRHNWASRTLLCSSYHLAPDTIDAYLDALAEFGPHLIDAYPSALASLANRALARGDGRIRAKAIITSSETLHSEVRDAAEAAFGCRVFDHYGAAEMAAFITQCERGAYHVNPEYGIVELIVDGRPARIGESGEIVATGFVNDAMPFIRYATGDVAVMTDEHCRCGRAFPVVERLEGRSDDVITTLDGRKIGRLDPVFKVITSIHEARIVQDAPGHVRVEVVPWDVLPDRERSALKSELERRLGPTMKVSIVEVDRLERTRAGKLRTVVNLVDPPVMAPVGARVGAPSEGPE